MANPNSSALRSFAAEPYDSVAAVLASKQITAALAGQRVFTKDGICFEVLSDTAAAWDEETAGGAKLGLVNTGAFDMDNMQDGSTKVAMTVAEREAVAGAVRHDAAQTLTSGQQQQARENISAPLGPDAGWQALSGSGDIYAPPSGRWAYFYVVGNASGQITGTSSGIVAGGGLIVSISAGSGVFGFAWRIA